MIPSESYAFRMSETRPLESIQDGAKIRELRKAAGYPTATAFAHRIGIKPDSMINIERGHRSASLSLMVRIARELDKPIESLLKEAEAA